jgi:hypothetical protein
MNNDIIIDYNGYLALLRILAEISGAFQALEVSRGEPLTESQLEAIGRFRAKVDNLLNDTGV